MVAFDRPLARGDGLAYFMWLDSIAGDGDIDLGNQAEHFAHVNAYQVYWNAETERWATDFAHGSALLLAPTYWLAQAVERLGWLDVNREYFVGLQGRPFVYSFFGMLGVNLLALGALALAYAAARRFAGPAPSAWAALLLFLGTPALYYATIEPFYAHIPATFLAALSFYCLVRGEEGPRALAWAFAAGLAGGFATLVRWQMALLVCGAALWLPLRRAWRDAAAFGMGFWAVAWHVLYTWQWMFGQPKVVSAAESGFLSLPRHFFDVLFADGRGLFVWAPLTLLAVAGWALLARSKWALALALGGTLFLQTFINGGVIDWWGGWSYGMRRMTELYPLFVAGLAYLLERTASRRWLRRSVRTVAVLCVAFSLLLFLSHLNFINTVVEQPQGDRASVEIRYQLTQSSFHVTWLVIKDHYGPWAWSRPGP
ncbi:MAG: hypothetical protein JXD18_10280 [Anaerolineae bacterium]|nr:hypothetical protein [Anaerolineae bacterium]